MKRTLATIKALLLSGISLLIPAKAHALPPAEGTDLYAFQVQDGQGKHIGMDAFKGKTLLIVNVASYCGYTKQYAPLEALYKKYKDQGLVILGFPCNQFGNQEPGTNEEIQSFCELNYGVTFPIMGKIEVNGDSAHPLYVYLKAVTGGKTIQWNFNKFLIDKTGTVVKRYKSGDSLDLLETDIVAIL